MNLILKEFVQGEIEMWKLFQLGIIRKEEIGINYSNRYKKVDGILMSYYISNA